MFTSLKKYMLVLLLYVKEVTIIIDKKEASLMVAESKIHKFFKVWMKTTDSLLLDNPNSCSWKSPVRTELSGALPLFLLSSSSANA